jgi:antitoxin PrlF
MPQSTLTDKGQTTIPARVRKAMNLQPHQQIVWDVQPDGSAIVRPQRSALELFGSLKPKVPFPGIKAEKEAAQRAMAEEALPSCHLAFGRHRR